MPTNAGKCFRLNTGWSMKTAILGINPNRSKSSPLDADEQEAICGVIQRAEQLDVNEKERVIILLYFYILISLKFLFHFLTA